MHKKFDHQEIEKRWQDEWEKSGIYDITERDRSREKEYVLVELPYPSGNLHIGHWFAFAVTDIFVRSERMKGKQVFFPIGFDAFGLPAENAAIKRGLDPKEWTYSNIDYMTKQLRSMGNSFTWNASHQTCDPEYYKWTQWMFTQFFENDIAFQGIGTVNWCPSCNTVLANEQVQSDGTCERCDTEVEKKEMQEWKLRITQYANRLIDDLEKVEWPEHIKESQRRWIGRSEGSLLKFKVKSEKSESDIEVFTTRADTLYGATYLVLAPEHEFVSSNRDEIENWTEVDAYINEAAKKDEITRTAEGKEKTGVKLEGITATNPANGEEIPVYIADYVLRGYGTGAIMAVPAHDQRDFEFAQKYDIPITQVIAPLFVRTEGEDAFRGEEDTIERDAITAVVKHWSDEKYLILKWKGVDWQTFITGGVEEGQTPEEAAKAEVFEETGFTNIRSVQELPKFHAKFFHVPKNVNRFAHFRTFYFELENDEQEPVSLEETEKHDVVWVDAEDVANTLTPPGHKFVWGALTTASAYANAGILTNSGEFDGMDSEEAKKAITEKVGGKLTNTYRLRDWSVGRQRYWGVPVPIVYDPEGKPHAIPKEHLPWLLPTDVDFKPTGEPPLAKSKELKERTEKIFGEGWTPAAETLDTFVDSSWYFLRYLEPHNDDEFSSMESQKTWMPIDYYFGGSEHTTMHLLYSRFWQKALFDLGLVSTDEPYKMRINRGLVLGPDGNKMSKSKGNVIDPDEQVERLGSDTVKMYLAFLGPYGEAANYPWDTGGIAGLRRFLERVYGLHEHIFDAEPESVTKLLHKTIAKVRADVTVYKFNTAISALMVLVNTIEKEGSSRDTYLTLLKLLAPFAPHVTEELWHQIGQETSIHLEPWPEFDPELVKEDTVTIGVQINGKLRGEIIIAPDASESEAIDTVRNTENLSARLTGEISKIIYIPGKILNIIIASSKKT